jgi:DNA ligase-associated metallophosphoesterase
MKHIQVLDLELCLSPERAVYIQDLGLLLVADVHLGKSETFQQAGIPIASQVNEQTLARLTQLCHQLNPQEIWILGDLFHARKGISEGLLQVWMQFLEGISASVHLILGNHDRALVPLLAPFQLTCYVQPVEFKHLLLSHEPIERSPIPLSSEQTPPKLNICGHVHPCLRLQSRLDSLRLPCFHLDRQQHRLVLPSFGEFTGGYEVTPTDDTVLYAIAEQSIIPFEGCPQPLSKHSSRRRR